MAARPSGPATGFSTIRKSMPSGLTRGWIPVFAIRLVLAEAGLCGNKNSERAFDSVKGESSLVRPWRERLLCVLFIGAVVWKAAFESLFQTLSKG